MPRTNVKIVPLGLGLKQCSCEFTSSAADVDGRASLGIRLGFAQDFVGDGAVSPSPQRRNRNTFTMGLPSVQPK